jgi:tRNA-dihydrouridine synthase
MIGRGVLKDPFLPSENKGINLSPSEKRKKRIEFHEKLLEGYLNSLDNKGNVLDKMKQFWSYFCYGFKDGSKVFKRIKKANDFYKYLYEAEDILKHTSIL